MTLSAASDKPAARAPATPEATISTIRAEVFDCLEHIVDPCSVAMGAPAGLVTFGLVRDVDVDLRPAGVHVSISLAITEPGCLMGAVFCANAEEALAKLPSVTSVDVRVDRSEIWTEDSMAPRYRDRLAQVRDKRSAARVGRGRLSHGRLDSRRRA